MSLSVRSLIQRAQAADARQLAARLGPLVLLGPPTGNEECEEEAGASRWRYLTERGDTPLAHNPLGQLLDAVVHPIRKRTSGGAFGAVVLVGRAESNDICIPHGSVSKLHARIEIDERGLWLEDAGSTNGTFYDGEAVGKDEGAQLLAGHRVRFGDVPFTLFDTARLHGMLSRFSGPIVKP